jgi:putative redox protein
MSSSAQPNAGAPSKVITRTEVTWLGERLFEAGPPGRTHRIDAGAKEAPGPVETLLNSLATCAGVDIVEIIAKRKTPVERMTVKVAGERRPEFPRRLLHVDIEYRIDGAGIEPEHALRAVQLSFEAYCSVAASLAPDITIDAEVVLNGEELAPIKIKVWSPKD